MDTLKDNGNFEQAPHHGRTLGQLIDAYQTDPVSSYHKLRYHTRRSQGNTLRRLVNDYGHIQLSAIKHRVLVEWHMKWSDNGKKLSMAHAFVACIRTLCGFGASMLEDEQAERISMVLHRMRFPHGAPRQDRLTSDQANAIRDMARANFGWPSMALCQALQFELLLRQKDCLGEWVPLSEPGETDIRDGDMKWLRGLRWEEIDENLILRHKTSKRQKVLEIDLRLAPMVVEELALFVNPFGDITPAFQAADLTRSMFPASGAVVINEITGYPWSGNEYRRKWRKVATAAGIPKEVRSMDSRAGGITEATEAGADIEHVKHAATHSDIAMTQRYSRGSTEKIANVQKIRTQHRDKFRHNS